MKHKLLEIGKDLVIAALLVAIFCLVLLALPASVVGRLPLLGAVAQRMGITQNEPHRAVSIREVAGAAAPLSIAVRSAAGLSVVRCDFAALDECYGACGVYLGEALASAGDAEVITTAQFQSLLQSESILFSFGAEIPADALAAWLGADECGVSAAAADFALIPDPSGNGVRLVLRGERILLFGTQVAAPSVREVMAKYVPDGASLAFEVSDDDALSALDPLTVVTESDALPAATGENPCGGDYAGALATAFGFNPYGTGSYTDPAGNTSFTESGRTLSISADGNVSFACADRSYEPFAAADASAAAVIDAARSAVMAVIGDHIGDARLYLGSFTRDGKNAKCTFRYVLGGAVVGGAPIELSYENGRLSALRMTVRTYRLGAEAQRLMPLRQAAVLAAAGSRPVPAYEDDGTGTLAVGWAKQ